jgi:hypothetical protein
MIKTEQLTDAGFEQNELGDWSHQDFPHIKFTYFDGAITGVREMDNYHGLSLSITTIRELLALLKYLPD